MKAFFSRKLSVGVAFMFMKIPFRAISGSDNADEKKRQ